MVFSCICRHARSRPDQFALQRYELKRNLRTLQRALRQHQAPAPYHGGRRLRRPPLQEPAKAEEKPPEKPVHSETVGSKGPVVLQRRDDKLLEEFGSLITKESDGDMREDVGEEIGTDDEESVDGEEEDDDDLHDAVSDFEEEAAVATDDGGGGGEDVGVDRRRGCLVRMIVSGLVLAVFLFYESLATRTQW